MKLCVAATPSPPITHQIWLDKALVTRCAILGRQVSISGRVGILPAPIGTGETPILKEM
ncbi:MAG: hypothetical protein HC769_29585 [Cyanobacteria bacterium CRU_2_1]|nr:hypothetical protein [Cyanobacteria bacterium CRU_2_1]